MSPSKLSEMKVVIVGCGFAGAQVASQLNGKCHLTVIDPREYFHHCIGSPRAAVEAGFEKKILIPLSKAWGDKFKQVKVRSVDPEKKVVILEDGEEISYDFVVIATGSTSPFPGKIDLDVLTIAEAESHYKKLQEQINVASKITVVGAGAVGVETAAEIAEDFPSKKVTVVTNADNVVGGPFKDKMRASIKNKLADLGVVLIFNEKVTNLDELSTSSVGACTVKTDKGTEIEADFVIVSTGMHVNTEIFQEKFGDKMDERKNIKVNQFLQVEGHEDVFAIGDCNNADSVKMALKCEGQAQTVAKNIQALCGGKSLKPYKEVTDIIAVSLGRSGGAMQLKFMTFGSFVTSRLKSRDLFVGKQWSLLNQKLPANTK